MTRTEQLILEKYPNRLQEMLNTIELMKKDYDQDQFLEEDIMESILTELNII